MSFYQLSDGILDVLSKFCFFLKQQTAYEMLISDWSSDVCSSDLFPDPSNLVLAGSIAVLALVGAALQDSKKERLQTDTWRAWEAKTSYWPFAAIDRKSVV